MGTLKWVDWFNNRRLLGPIGNIPTAEAGGRYYARNASLDIIGAGELIYWFGRLVKGAGGFGEAMRLLKDVAIEVWERIKLGGKSLGAALSSAGMAPLPPSVIFL